MRTLLIAASFLLAASGCIASDADDLDGDGALQSSANDVSAGDAPGGRPPGKPASLVIGTPGIVASGAGDVRFLTCDGTSVFWFDGDTSMVMAAGDAPSVHREVYPQPVPGVLAMRSLDDHLAIGIGGPRGVLAWMEKETGYNYTIQTPNLLSMWLVGEAPIWASSSSVLNSISARGPATLLSGIGTIGQTYFDASGLYWNNVTTSTIHKAATSGAGDTIIASGAGSASSIAAVNDRVYWGTTGGLNYVPRSGGATTTFVGAATHVTAAGEYVAWARPVSGSQSAINVVSPALSGPAEVARATGISSMAYCEQELFWANGAGEIWSASIE